MARPAEPHLAQRDLRELTADRKSADAEMASPRRSAAADPLLSVPPSILVALAELGAEPPVVAGSWSSCLRLWQATLSSRRILNGSPNRPQSRNCQLGP